MNFRGSSFKVSSSKFSEFGAKGSRFRVYGVRGLDLGLPGLVSGIGLRGLGLP